MHSDWRSFLSLDFTFSRRSLGFVLLLIGSAAASGILAIDLFDIGREGGIGPAQTMALLAAIGAALIGVTLLPLTGLPATAAAPAEPLPMPKTLYWLQRGIFGIAALLLVFALVVYGAYAVNLMQFPFDYDQGEGFELMDTVLLSRGILPYLNTEVYPFYSSNYSPLYHVIAAPLVWFFGEAYWYGRLLSFLSTFVTAGAIAYAVQRASRQRTIAVFAGLAFLASNTVYHIGPLFRQHISMVMFETLGIVILAHAFPKRQTRLIALGLFMLILAGYTKQLAAISAIAALAWLFLHNPRRAIVWGIGFAAVGGGIFLWLNVATGGEWWRQAIAANVGGIDPLQVQGLFRLWFQLHGFLVILALAFVAYELYFARLSLYSVWFVVTTVIGGVASGTWGGGDSYFATSIAAMCLTSGIFAARTLNQAWHFEANYLSRPLFALLRGRATLIYAVLALLLPLLYVGYGRATLKMPTEGAFFGTVADIFGIQPNIAGRHFDSANYDVKAYAYIGHFTTQADIDAGYAIVARMNATDKPVLSEEAGFAFVAGREVITNPTQLLNLWRAGLFQGDALLAMIEQQEFGLLVMRAQFYPTPILLAMGQHYTLRETILMNGFEYQLWYPQSAD
jgi:hypothetical protein